MKPLVVLVFFLLYLHLYYITETKKGGLVEEICNCHIDNGRSEVEVLWENDDTTTSNRILDLKYNTGGAFHYYHCHLPALGNGTNCVVLFKVYKCQYVVSDKSE